MVFVLWLARWWLFQGLWAWHFRRPRGVGPGFRRALLPPAHSRQRHNKKPEWVFRQLVLLAAHLPDAGCRTLALTFNRVFTHRGVSVSKSFVHRALREHAHAVWLARKAMRNAAPRAVPVNHTWGLDLTGRQDGAGRVHTLLGLLDHGSRRVLALRTVARKSGWYLLGCLCFAVGQFGKPRFIRTDNERCFTDRVFAAGLRLLGIGHQRIDLHCP